MAVVSDPAKTLKAITQCNDCPPFILIVSSNRIRRERTIQHIIDRFLPKNKDIDNAVIKIRSEELNEQKMRAIGDEILNISLFSPLRFFVISEVDELSPVSIDRLVNLIDNLDSSCKVIASASKVAQSNTLLKLAKNLDTLLQLEDLKGYDLRRWSERELRNFGIKDFEDSALDRIIEISESDPDEISQQIEQLSLYIDNDKLTANDVAELFTKAPNPSEFALLDQITLGDRGKTEILISQLVNSGKSPFALLALLARSFTNYLLIALYIERGLQRSDIKQLLGLSPWILNKAFPIAERYGVRKLRRCLRAILIADSKLKNRSLGTEIIFSELTARL